MHDSVPPAGTVRVVTRGIEESVGHVARVCGLFVTGNRSISQAKTRILMIPLTLPHKSKRCKYLRKTRSEMRVSAWKSQQN